MGRWLGVGSSDGCKDGRRRGSDVVETWKMEGW
jgi:hypothetical protein